MPNTLQKGQLMDPVLVNEMINTVTGRSALAALSGAAPIPFNGFKEFIFSMSDGFDIVAEGGAKSAQELKIEPVVVVPIKMVYQTRVSDEFIYGSQEAKLDIMRNFIDGCASQMAKSLDIAAFHGLNPKTMTASTVIGDNCFDKKIKQCVVYDSSKPDDVIDAAISVIEAADADVTGMVLAPAVRSDLAAMRNSASGTRLYPDFAFGGKPNNLGGYQLDINSTVAKGVPSIRGYVGDFKGRVRWGYAKEITFETIQFGDPDNTGRDLKGYNEVCLRAEVYLGWGILIPEAFVRIADAGVSLNKHNASVAVSGTTTITATTTPTGKTVTWTSSDTSKATVSNGTVTGVAAGSAIVTASVTVDGLTYESKCAVTVTAS